MKKEDFIKKQNRIYDEIIDVGRNLENIIPCEFDNKGGYIIALRHSAVVVEVIKRFNSEISNIIKIMNYDEKNIHTTMATYLEANQFEPDEKILDKIGNIVYSFRDDYRKMKLCYYDYLLDCSAIILAGKFNEDFYVNCEKIANELGLHNICVKSPWGTHVTVCRFLENGNSEQIQKIKRIMHEYKRELHCEPSSIDIGYYKNDGNTFDLCVYKRIDL